MKATPWSSRNAKFPSDYKPRLAKACNFQLKLMIYKNNNRF